MPTNDPNRLHNQRIEQYIRRVSKLYGVTIDDFTAMVAQIELNPDKAFSFDDFPALKGKANKAFDKFAASLQSIINTATEAEWLRACKDVSDAVKDIANELGYQSSERNLEALKAFQQRKTGGMNLSDRVWNYTEQFRQEMELALDIGIGEGRSAAELSRDVRRYLKQPERLFRRVWDKHGNLVLSQAAKAFNPGQGVYRSSFKNARRLTATETNMAYRKSDNERWQQLFFVVGFEVKLSNNHTINGVPFTDICDDLVGKYPKTFVFTGWHPQCHCFAIPILMTPEEFAEASNMKAAGEDISRYRSKNAVDDVPDGFKKWVADNADRIEKANNRGTLPYFLKDNATFAGISVKGMNLMEQVNKDGIKELRAWARENIVGKKIPHPQFEKQITITSTGVKEYLNQPFKAYFEKNNAIKNIVDILQSSEYLGISDFRNSEKILYSHIFETEAIGNMKSWLIVREITNGDVNFYSISDSEKVLTGLKRK